MFGRISPMGLQQWYSLKGRISRKTWWIFYFLIPNGIILAIGILDARVLPKIFLPQTLGKGFSEVSVVSGLAILFGLWITLAGQVKRLHDHDRTGWWACLTLIPTCVGIWLLSVLRGGHSFGGSEIYLITQFAFPLFGTLLLFAFDDPYRNTSFDDLIFPGALFLCFLWVAFFINGGILRGKFGPNRFGPDPLAPPDAANIALPPQPQ
jgi:uncharacterized membrane protein YhaH (DUF805 family)